MSEIHPVFENLKMLKLNSASFDEHVLEGMGAVQAVFFWGHDCPNCEVAKRMLNQNEEDVLDLRFSWYHVNVYEDPDLGTRFGLHGIPTFLFFKNGKRLGRISPFPGMEQFLEALRKLN